MKCIKPIDGHACGRCRACRINIQRDKKVRIVHEGESYKNKCFLTLTYDPKQYDDQNLIKSDLQNFMKCLRRRIEPDRIKYFACGEYGEEERHHAHFHAILFGVDMYDKRLFTNHHYDPVKNVWRVSCSVWNKGFVTVAPFNEKRAAYVARYTIDKISGKEAEEWYKGRTPEFCLTSNGLGLRWCMSHKELLKQDGCIRQGLKRVPLPRYYQDKLFPKDTFRGLEWRRYKSALSAKRFEDEKKRSGTHDKESFEKWQAEVRKQTALFMAQKLQRKEKLKSHV